MIKNYIGEPDIHSFSKIINKMRSFCLKKGFNEVHTQDRLSILAACEDPETIAMYNYRGRAWPLPQTGQMWLEYELLKSPELPGVFCVSTSYRDEPNPVPGRHKTLFPMFEFELRGSEADLIEFETELLEYLEFGDKKEYVHKTYDELKNFYKVRELSHIEEGKMENDFGRVVFCKKFPSYTSPFWNMKKIGEDYSHKIDVILCGMEVIGSAERSCDPDQMWDEFHTISKGEYAKKLFGLFGRQRVEDELRNFLSLNFFPRCGGGIGMTRMINVLKRINTI